MTGAPRGRAAAAFVILLNLALATYAGAIAWIFLNGRGILFNFGPLEVKATNPMKLVFILVALALLRLMISLPPKRAGLVGFSILFSLLLAEIGLRALAPGIASTPELQRWRRPNLEIGYELVPNLKGMGAGGYDIAINSHGMRDHERPWEKPEGTMRLLGIGDSFTFGAGVELSETFLKRLEALMKGAGTNADVINAGVIGYSSYHCLAMLKTKGILFRPDIVLYFFFLDDFCHRPDAEELRRNYDAAMASPDAHAAPPTSISYLYNTLKNVVSLVGNRYRYLDDAEWLRTADSRREIIAKSLPDSSLIASFRDQVREMNAVASDSGAKFMIVLVPDVASLGSKELQQVNLRVKEICDAEKIPFLDPTAHFEAAPDPLGLYMLPFDAHTSPKGNDLLGQLVFDKLNELGWIK